MMIKIQSNTNANQYDKFTYFRPGGAVSVKLQLAFTNPGL